MAPHEQDDPDFDLLRLTQVEQTIIREALAKEISGEKLTIVEEVLLREYKLKLQARESERELRRAVEKRAQKTLENGSSV
jgi:hypothetical protein